MNGDTLSQTSLLLGLAKDIGEVKERCVRVEEGIVSIKTSHQNIISWNTRQDAELKELQEIRNNIKTAWKVADWLKHSGIATGAIALYHYFFGAVK